MLNIYRSVSVYSLQQLKIYLHKNFERFFQPRVLKLSISKNHKNTPLSLWPKGVHHSILLFPLNCAWWLRCNVIDDAVDVVYFVYNTT